MTKPLTDLTDLQLLVLGVLWETGGATATEVHGRLEAATGLTRKTIGTLLHRLDRQAIVTAQPEGREFRYRASVTREEVKAARLSGLVGGLFEGDVASMVSFALAQRDVDPAALVRLRALLDDTRPGAAS
jgi:predicted transcriptional regulator